jgi:hypothetical protein
MPTLCGISRTDQHVGLSYAFCMSKKDAVSAQAIALALFLELLRGQKEVDRGDQHADWWSCGVNVLFSRSVRTTAKKVVYETQGVQAHYKAIATPSQTVHMLTCSCLYQD